MSSTDTIVLRPRFKLELNKGSETALKAFEDTSQEVFIVTRVDHHVFIKFPKHKQQFWTPQLHLEIDEADANSCLVKGLFGPNPTVWTLFMFLHFAVIGLFIAFAIWTYSNSALGKEYLLQIWGMLFMVIIWFVLYFSGRIGRTSNKDEMLALYNFMKSKLDIT
jgi:hypothetical protein